jgi:hypothetical protein
MIPDWNLSGVLPPIRPGMAGFHPDRSPYEATMPEIVERFATTQPRAAILRGLLNYRAAFQAAGVSQGFQWLDGSFMEEKERLLNQAPNDVDAVTFFHLPADLTQTSFGSANAGLFDHEKVKSDFKVDGYSFVLGERLGIGEVQLISYWYSMWSHRRDGLWKGFVQIPFSTVEDETASAMLLQIEMEEHDS